MYASLFFFGQTGVSESERAKKRDYPPSSSSSLSLRVLKYVHTFPPSLAAEEKRDSGKTAEKQVRHLPENKGGGIDKKKVNIWTNFFFAG